MRENGIPNLSYATRYLHVLRRLKCLPAEIKTVRMDKGHDNDDWAKDGKIEGTWQLLVDFGTGDTVDYSCESVTCTFRSNGKATIKSNVGEIPGGEFAYTYYSDPYGGFLSKPSPHPRPNLVIGESEKYCQVMCSWLTVFSVAWGKHQSDTVPDVVRGEAERIYYKIN
jgi:hypothetical protein